MNYYLTIDFEFVIIYLYFIRGDSVKKIKKAAKIEKVFGNSSKEELVFDEKKPEEYDALSEFTESEEIDNNQDDLENEISEKQIQKQNEIEAVRSKISKILKSSNIEIVDENLGDEYEAEDEGGRQSQQDYDTLKAMFGDKDRNKKDELTLTIDDFDYTYVGRYLEEFDLMHVKNIKHIRMKNPYAKKIKKVLIAAAAVMVVGIAGVVAYFATRDNPVTMTSVALSQETSTSKYYVGENFSFDGLFINVGYSDGSTKRIPVTIDNIVRERCEGGRFEIINDNIQFLGGSVLMAIDYEGYNLSYSVEVKNKELRGIDARYADGILNLNAGEYITGHLNGKEDLTILLNYGSYGISKVSSYSNITILVDGEACTYSAGLGWKVPKSTKGATIIVQYGEYNYIIE